MANPVTSILGPAGDRTLLYYITPEGRLAMNEYTKTTDTWSDNGCPVAAVLPTPNHISSAYQNGMVFVYGMIEKPDTPTGKPTEYIISELSPTVRYFASTKKDTASMTTTLNILAVVGDGKLMTWFYYFKKASEEGAIELKSMYFSEGNPAKLSTINSALPNAQSRLSALYLPETNTRVVFYQTATKTISIVTITDSKVFTQDVDNTLGAMEGTPLAVSYSGTDKNRTLYLYYVSNVKQLTKAIGSWNGNSWSWNTQTTILGTTRFTKESSQLSVTHDPNQNTNRIFFMEKDSDIYEDLSDGPLTV